MSTWPITAPTSTWVAPQDPVVAEQWPDTVDMDPDLLGRVMAAAQEQCEAYAPALPEDRVDVPSSWKIALVMQARAIYRATIAGSGDQIGVDGMAITVFPMDWTVKNLLRPKRSGVWVR